MRNKTDLNIKGAIEAYIYARLDECSEERNITTLRVTCLTYANDYVSFGTFCTDYEINKKIFNGEPVPIEAANFFLEAIRDEIEVVPCYNLDGTFLNYVVFKDAFISSFSGRAHPDGVLYSSDVDGLLGTPLEFEEAGYEYLDTCSAYVHKSNIFVSTISGNKYSKNKHTSAEVYDTDIVGTIRELDQSDEFIYSRHMGRYIRVEDSFETVDNQVMHTSMEDECFNYHGYVFSSRNNAFSIDRTRISSYHCSPPPFDLSKGSEYKIGFEVEKNEFDGGFMDEGDMIGEHLLFKGYELDSSCGVEAITNILPLVDPSDERYQSVMDMMDDAQDVIEYGETDDRCSCHATISVSSMSDAYSLVSKIRPYMSVVYALFRHRLNNNYCNLNKKLDQSNTDKYSTIRIKSDHFEIRLPSRLKSAKQLKRRYDLFYQVVHAGITDMPFDEFMEKIDPILKDMYSHNLPKYETVKSYIEPFRKYLVVDQIDEIISEFI